MSTIGMFPKTADEALRRLADTADEVLVNLYDADMSHDEETDDEYPDVRRLRVAERLARRFLRRKGGET